MDLLDQEAEEDESFRADHSINRLPSHEVNEELTGKGQRYGQVLDQAADSDQLVRQKWDEWENNIVELTWDEVCDLETDDLFWPLIKTSDRASASIGSLDPFIYYISCPAFFLGADTYSDTCTRTTSST